jgi:hypothetical protein
MKLNEELLLLQFPGNGARKLLLDAGRITTQLGTPRGRYDEYSSKFSLSKKPRFIVSRKKPNSRR